MTQASRVFGALFGSFDRLSDKQQNDAVEYLLMAWRAQAGRDLSTLSEDLELLSDLFQPHMQAKRLRSAAEKLSPISGPRPIIPPELLIPCGPDRGFVTPEGRVLIELRNHTQDHALQEMTLRLARFYAEPQRAWMAKTLGAGGDLRPQSIGFCFFLLLNNSVGEGHALTFPAQADDELQLAEAVMGVADAFSRAIGGSPVAPRERTRLRSNWIVTETHRQLQGLIRLHDHAGLVRCYVAIGAEGRLIQVIGHILARRPALNLSIVLDSMESVVNAYDYVRPLLKSWGMSWERPEHSREIRQSLETAYVKSMAEGSP